MADDLTLRAGRDRISGILRFAADRPQWQVRILSIGTENLPAEFNGLSARQAGLAAVIGDDQDFSRILRPRWNSSRRIPHVVIDPYLQTGPRHRAHVVISVDDIAICENLRPTLSSIQPDFEGAGFLAAQKIDEMLKNGCPRKTETFHYGVRSIVERASALDIRGGGRLVGLAREYMRQHAAEPITTVQIAKELNVCARTLERRFREIQHCGVAEVLRHYRLERACTLLRETDRTINDISGDVGFDSPNHLKTAFKKAFGMTMRDYRNGLSIHHQTNDAVPRG